MSEQLFKKLITVELDYTQLSFIEDILEIEIEDSAYEGMDNGMKETIDHYSDALEKIRKALKNHEDSITEE